MTVLISDPFDPNRRPRRTPIRAVPDRQLRILALAGSVEAVLELARRRQEAGRG